MMRDFSVTKPSNIEGIETATLKSWQEWVNLLESAGAKDLDHSAIADIVRKQLEDKIDSPGWWAQNVTVAYEQHIGRRRPGQQNDGSFEMSVTKHIAGTKEDVFALWREAHDDTTDFSGAKVSNIRMSETPVRLYWRCELADGSKISISVEERSPVKAMIAATHTNILTEEQKDTWRTYWKNTLESL